MITKDFVAGSPCWLDLGAPDVTAAASFYGTVFGWDFERYTGEDAPEGMEYGTLKQDGHAVGAIGKLTEEGARSAWTLYFDTPDADATAQAVEKGGGSVRVPPMDAGDMGRMAQFTDPQGGQFAVWQPGKDRGLEAVDEPGTLCWTELMTTDSAAAKEFYGSLFDWQTSDMDLPGGGGVYSLITPGLPEDRMQGGLMQFAGRVSRPQRRPPLLAPRLRRHRCRRHRRQGHRQRRNPPDGPGGRRGRRPSSPSASTRPVRTSCCSSPWSRPCGG